jgi:hypothetical protein
MRMDRIRQGLIEEVRSDIPLDVPPISPEDFLLFQRDEKGSPRVFLLSWTDKAEGRVVEIRFDPHCARHSRDGFEWGYGGSGPAELARYLTYGVACHIELPRDRWDDLDYQRVKWEIVARIPRHGGMYPASEIYRALRLPETTQSEEGDG